MSKKNGEKEGKIAREGEKEKEKERKKERDRQAQTDRPPGLLHLVRGEQKGEPLDEKQPTTSLTLWRRENNIDVNTRVELHSLKTAKYNSQRGKVLSRPTAEEDNRCNVLLDSGTQLRVKLLNLLPIESCGLSLRALPSSDVYNTTE